MCALAVPLAFLLWLCSGDSWPTLALAEAFGVVGGVSLGWIIAGGIRERVDAKSGEDGGQLNR
jgi:hypothetical protein